MHYYKKFSVTVRKRKTSRLPAKKAEIQSEVQSHMSGCAEKKKLVNIKIEPIIQYEAKYT